MPRLQDIRGQVRAVERLRGALAAGRVHHAYLLTGPAGCGKRATALALAGALNCLRAPGEGCGADDPCDTCARIDAGVHPDVITLEREGAAQIVPIEAIRQQVIARVALPPHEARVRVFLFDEAAALQPAAANALLKTLEEPPLRTMFVLATVAPDQLLPTIRSRCQRLRLEALSADDRVRLAADDEAAAAAARLAALADDVASFAGDGPPDAAGFERAAALAARVAEDKQAAPVLELAAQRLGAAARRAAGGWRLAAARVTGQRAALVLDTHAAITGNNAHPQLAVEALLGRLWALPHEASHD